MSQSKSEVSKEILVEALFDLAQDVAMDAVASPTVLVLGDVETYTDKVPSEYGDSIPGKQIDSFQGTPIKVFNPRYAYVEDSELILGDGHLGEERYSDLPAEFEHKISTDEYSAAIIYQEDSDNAQEGVRVSSIGSL